MSRTTVLIRGGVDTPLGTLFEEQVRRAPEAVALVAGGQEVSYRELNSRANRLARRLAADGTRPGDVAGVLLERGIDLVVALLAVLKAGAAYTLLDPDLPAERLGAALADTGARVLVTRRALAAPEGPERLLIDEQAAAIAELPDGDLGLPVRPDAVACAMFTSGSTGRPKGVLASHRALTATYLEQDYALFAPGEVWLQCSPVSWDAFGLEVFGPLLFGGVCVLQPGQRPEPKALAALVVERAVTHLQLSASLFNFLVDHFPETFEPLKVVYTGGERASVAHVAAAVRRFPGLRVVNGYGPVESLGFTTCHTVTAADLGRDAIPVGRPLAHKGIRVLDEHLAPVPPGVQGEVYATGDGLAHGYAARPGLTAERFLPDPYGPPGARMYRTGDLGHWNADGALEISGRIDGQVKLRGFRVEPGEVEHALGRHPAVRDCAVAVHTPADGEPRLIAYITTAAAVPPGYREIRDHLAALLPDYMIPAGLTVLPALPLTANGKLDRAALPAPAVVKAAADGSEGGLLRRVAEVWSEVLGVPDIAPGDDFYLLGGHSLTALRTIYVLRDRLGVDIPLRELLDARDLAEFAAAVERRMSGEGPARPAVPLLGRRGTR